LVEDHDEVEEVGAGVHEGREEVEEGGHEDHGEVGAHEVDPD
jgi:hypothetical protein